MKPLFPTFLGRSSASPHLYLFCCLHFNLLLQQQSHAAGEGKAHLSPCLASVKRQVITWQVEKCHPHATHDQMAATTAPNPLTSHRCLTCSCEHWSGGEDLRKIKQHPFLVGLSSYLSCLHYFTQRCKLSSHKRNHARWHCQGCVQFHDRITQYCIMSTSFSTPRVLALIWKNKTKQVSNPQGYSTRFACRCRMWGKATVRGKELSRVSCAQATGFCWLHCWLSITRIMRTRVGCETIQ